MHRADCAALARLAATSPQRILPVEWGQAGGGYEVDVVVDAVDRRWLLKDITNLIAQEDAYVLDIHSDNVRNSGRAPAAAAEGERLRPAVDPAGQAALLPGVSEARRLG